MKKFLATAVLAALATVAFAQSNQVDTFVQLNLPNLNDAEANQLAKPSGGQKTSKAPNLEVNAKYTFTAKIDDANTVKAGAAIDFDKPLYAGDAEGALQPQWAAKVIEPFVQYQGFGLDVQTSVAVYTFSPSDKANIAAGKKAVGYYTGPLFTVKKPAEDNTMPVSNYGKATYKYAFDKTLAVVAGAEYDLAVAPFAALLDVKPQASVIWTFVQADAKYNITYAGITDDADTTYAKTYLEPKFTFDLKEFVTPGLKAYTGGKLMLGNDNPTKAAALLTGDRWDVGCVYTYTVKDVGTFGFDTYFRAGGFGKDDDTDKTLQYDVNLKATYSLKF